MSWRLRRCRWSACSERTSAASCVACMKSTAWYFTWARRSSRSTGHSSRSPDVHTGERIRVEHWVLAQRQGQVAALNMLGLKRRFDAVPFFWSQHYDVAIQYVGHAERWDHLDIDGKPDALDCTARYSLAG